MEQLGTLGIMLSLNEVVNHVLLLFLNNSAICLYKETVKCERGHSK